MPIEILLFCELSLLESVMNAKTSQLTESIIKGVDLCQGAERIKCKYLLYPFAVSFQLSLFR